MAEQPQSIDQSSLQTSSTKSAEKAYKILNRIGGLEVTSKIAESLSQARRRARQIVERSGIMDVLQDGETHIDLGSGPGHILEEIKNKAAEQGKEIKFVGLDLLANPFKSIRGRSNKEVEGTNSTPLPLFLRGDAQVLPFQDGSADSISLFFVLHHMSESNKAQVLSEIGRVLKIGGRLILVEDTPKKEQTKSARRLDKIANYGLNQEGDDLTADEWINSLANLGYQLEKTTPFTDKIAGKDMPHTSMVFNWSGKPNEVASSGKLG